MSTVTTAEPFAIKTDHFEGPLELLLELVEKRKLLINDISLAAVTDDYMAEVSRMQELSLPNTAQFIQIAATLLLIKSKSLLPVLELTSEEEEAADDLEARLRRYALYRTAAETISTHFGITYTHERQYVPDHTPLFVTDRFTTVVGLEAAIGEVLVKLPRKEVKPRVQVKKVVSLEEMITRLQTRIETQLRVRFSELFEQHHGRSDMIVGFLAVLESVKQGNLLVAQIDRFGDIELSKERPSSVPRY